MLTPPGTLQVNSHIVCNVTRVILSLTGCVDAEKVIVVVWWQKATAKYCCGLRVTCVTCTEY